jgi:hypothetical protein
MPRTTNDRRDQRRELEELETLFGGVQTDADEGSLVDFVIPLFVDHEQRYTDHEICDQVRRSFGIDFDIDDLLRLQKTPTFQERWPLSEFGMDPRVAAARHAFADLLSLAMDQLRTLLTSANTPATVKMRAIQLITDMNKVENEQAQPSNMGELVKFLDGLGMGSQINQLNVRTLIYQSLPQEYQDAAEAVNSPTPERNLLGVGSGAQDTEDVVDGEVVDAPQSREDTPHA